MLFIAFIYYFQYYFYKLLLLLNNDKKLLFQKLYEKLTIIWTYEKLNYVVRNILVTG